MTSPIYWIGKNLAILAPYLCVVILGLTTSSATPASASSTSLLPQLHRNQDYHQVISIITTKMPPRPACKKTARSATPKKNATQKSVESRPAPECVDMSDLPDSGGQDELSDWEGLIHPGGVKFRPGDMTHEKRVAAGFAPLPEPDGQGHPVADHSPEHSQVKKVKPESPCKRPKKGSQPPSPGRTPNPNLMQTGEVSPTQPFFQPDELPVMILDLAGGVDGAMDDGDKDMKIEDPLVGAPVLPPPRGEPCPRAPPHEAECGRRDCIVSSIQVMFASTSKQYISEI